MNTKASYEAAFGAIAAHQMAQVEEFTCELCQGELQAFETDDAGTKFDKCKTCGELYKITI